MFEEPAAWRVRVYGSAEDLERLGEGPVPFAIMIVTLGKETYLESPTFQSLDDSAQIRLAVDHLLRSTGSEVQVGEVVKAFADGTDERTTFTPFSTTFQERRRRS